jgi:hypothetical protein
VRVSHECVAYDAQAVATEIRIVDLRRELADQIDPSRVGEHIRSRLTSCGVTVRVTGVTSCGPSGSQDLAFCGARRIDLLLLRVEVIR